MDLPLRIRHHPTARRLTLRLSPQGDALVVTAPSRASQREIARFVQRHEDWVAARLEARPARIPFAAGAVIPFAGEPHRLDSTGGLRGTVERGEGIIRVPGLPEHMPRRMRDYLMRQAREALATSLAEIAPLLDRKPPPFAVRDTTSRWGSCSPSGRLSFSWRLILAPPPVLDYVVAHEAAHLVHMNHGVHFWDLCARLNPGMDSARRWLKTHGAELHRYG
jgi:predicted metal-dependent hydrolase